MRPLPRSPFLGLICVLLPAIISVVGASFALEPGANLNGAAGLRVPILVYHRFGPTVADAMTVRTEDFSAQLKYLHERGYHVVPLREVVAWMRGGTPPPRDSIAITADDGHKTVFTDMLPLVERYRVPVTLFIYPSAISNASYAMTWEELRRLKATGLFDIQSHTFWHPNFKVEKRRLSPAQYEEFVRMQLSRSRQVLDTRLGLNVDMLAWPFGIYDDELIRMARAAGYVAGFTLKRASVSAGDDVMALPRYLMTDEMRGSAFAKFIARATAPASVRN